MTEAQLNSMKTLFLLLLLLHTHHTICNRVSALSLDSMKNSEIGAMASRVCAGKIGECTANEEEEMDSEINRRVLLMRKRYISYETLRRDLVPCTRPGASYYNCKAAGQANPYHRGCEVITGCARIISDIKS
ncbi:hypothetical protein NMG60_11017319 [Bertholletia excelsa]